MGRRLPPFRGPLNPDPGANSGLGEMGPGEEAEIEGGDPLVSPFGMEVPPTHTLIAGKRLCPLWTEAGVRGGLQAVPGGSVFDATGCVFTGAGRKGRHHPYTTLPGLSLLPSKPLSPMRLGLCERWLQMTPHYPTSFPCPQPSPPS